MYRCLYKLIFNTRILNSNNIRLTYLFLYYYFLNTFSFGVIMITESLITLILSFSVIILYNIIL